MSDSHLSTALRSYRYLTLPNAKEEAFNEQLYEPHDNPIISGVLGRVLIPIGILGSLFFAGSYLYHRFIPSYQRLNPQQCYEILYKIRTIWGQTITQSSRQEQKLLDDYKHLSPDQQAHLVDILRQTLLSDLSLSETYLFQHYNVTKRQMKSTIEYYTKTLPVKEQDQQLVKISHELIKLVRLVLPTPELPPGWDTHDALELISQWFEVRLQVMEKTYHSLGFDQIIFEPPTPTPSSKEIASSQLNSEDDFNMDSIDDIDSSSTPAQFTAKHDQNIAKKLTPDQLQILNEAYSHNVTLQIDTFCVEKGISPTFITYINKCVVNEPSFHAIITNYRDLQRKRFTPLGIDLKG